MIQKPTAPTCTPPPRNEGRLTSWQNAPTNPTSTDQYLYDGEGNRVEQKVANDGTTTTVYIGDLETVATSGSTTTTTTYYYAAGRRIALAVNGTLSYLASDLLGSATVSLDATGTPTASQLYAPYGGLRHQNGAMPTDYGFTGQRADSATGLDYYGARYYDPAIGQFTSADSVLDGLNRYSYVGGNPISRTDPSGHFLKPTNDQGKQIQPPQPITGQSPQGAGDDGPGGGGILPPINPVPLIKWIIDQFAIPTAYAPDGNWLDWSGNDEHTRARHLPDVVSLLDDMPYYNSRNTPRGKPTTSTPTNGDTGPHTPPTQTGVEAREHLRVVTEWRCPSILRRMIVGVVAVEARPTMTDWASCLAWKSGSLRKGWDW